VEVSGGGKGLDYALSVVLGFLRVWLKGLGIVRLGEEGFSDFFPVFDDSLKVFKLERLSVEGFLVCFLKVSISVIEFVEGCDKLGMIFLKTGKGWVFMWECREAIIIGFELVVGSSELRDLLCE
jgi:hypothetical protein